jgi:hypothetical protein
VQDAELTQRFLAGTLDSFAHRDHVRVGFLLLCANEFDEATLILSNRIRAMAAAAGDPNKFHATRTTAWMHLIESRRMAGSPPGDSEAFLRSHPELLRSSLLNDYYSAELLRSDGARAQYVQPDLAALR